MKLIVIDSLAFHFRHDMDNAALRSRVLHKIASQLTSLAVHFQLAVNSICELAAVLNVAG